jgi:hypothetical protein
MVSFLNYETKEENRMYLFLNNGRTKNKLSIRSSAMERTKRILSIRSSAMERTKKKLSIRSLAMERTKKNECICSSTMKRTKKNEGIRSSTIDAFAIATHDGMYARKQQLLLCGLEWGWGGGWMGWGKQGDMRQ